MEHKDPGWPLYHLQRSSFVHYCPSWSRGRYSLPQPFQNRSEKYWTCLHLLLMYKSLSWKSPGGRSGLDFNSRMWLGVSRLDHQKALWLDGHEEWLQPQREWYESARHPEAAIWDCTFLMRRMIRSPCSAMMRSSKGIKAPLYSLLQ